MHKAIQGEIKRCWWVQGWIYLDYAKAYKMMGEIDKAIAELREFYLRCKEMGSAHALSHVTTMLVHLDEERYGDVQAVKAFEDELLDGAASPYTDRQQGHRKGSESQRAIEPL